MATLNIKNFPDRLYAELKKLAERESRSIAQQVVHLLGEVVEQRGRLSILELRGLGKSAWKDVDAAGHVTEERDKWD